MDFIPSSSSSSLSSSSSSRVPSPIDEVFYIPNFVSEEEERYLLRKIYESSGTKWTTLPNRRLQIWGGEIISSSKTLIPQELPRFVTDYPNIISRLRATGAFSSSKHGQPNHIIVNEYQPGQGIMPHEDGPTYHAVVATLSLGSHAVFHYQRYVPERLPPDDADSFAAPRADDPTTTGTSTSTSSSSSGRAIDPEPVLSLLLEPRSVVITAKALYTHHLHAIEPRVEDVLAPAEEENDGSAQGGRGGEGSSSSRQGGTIKVANWHMLAGIRESAAARQGGTLERGTRVSLTCRVVERVPIGGKALAKALMK